MCLPHAFPSLLPSSITVYSDMVHLLHYYTMYSITDTGLQLLYCSPICSKQVSAKIINEHIDSSCTNLRIGSSAQQSVYSTAQIRQGKTCSSSPIAPIFKSNAGPGKTESAPQVLVPATKRQAEDHQSTRVVKRNKTTHLDSAAPLAERLRPTTLQEFVGQRHLTGSDSVLMNMLAGGSAGSLIFWGPPG